MAPEISVPLTPSFLPTVLNEETAFTRSHSQTVKQVHKFDKNTDDTLLQTRGYGIINMTFNDNNLKAED